MLSGVGPEPGADGLAGAVGSWPSLSVIMPVRDEGATLADAVASVLAQDYPADFDVVLAVAPSRDDTVEVADALAAGDARLRVVDNPAGSTPAGLNRAIAAASGAVVARVDGHARLPAGYLRRAVEVLVATGADNVGGVQLAQGVTAFEQAVAAAMSSRFGVGDARFHYGGSPGPVDTVYLGVFRRDALERVGGYDERFIRVQDAELNHRLRITGGTVYFHPDLQVAYRPRGSWPALVRQYFHSGRWRRVVVARHRRSVRWRQLVPPVTLVACVAGLVIAATGRPWGLVAPGGYAGAVVAASAVTGRDLDPQPRRWLPLVFATMHLAWAAGFVTSPRRLRRAGPV